MNIYKLVVPPNHPKFDLFGSETYGFWDTTILGRLHVVILD